MPTDPNRVAEWPASWHSPPSTLIRNPVVGRAVARPAGILRPTPRVHRGPTPSAAPSPDPSQGGAHEGRCRQGDGARRTACRPGTRSARQAQGGRARHPRRARRRRRLVHPRRRVPGGRRDGRLDRRPVSRRRCDPARRQAVRRRGQEAAQGPGPARPAEPAHRSQDRQGPGRARRDRDQPRRDPAHAVARPVDGRAVVAGERRWLQGRADRGQRLRPLLPAADDRGRDGQAGQRPDPGHRRGRAPGDRDRTPARRRGQGLRRPARDPRAGREPRRPVRQAQDARSMRPAPAATPAS